MEAQTAPFTHFYDLPQEVRDIIYQYYTRRAWIDITQMPDDLHQPVSSKVCKRIREESLDVHYGKMFLLDLRGWRSPSYPKRWTPFLIFEHWISAIGDKNAGRIRSLKFFSHNFTVYIKVSTESPQLVLKFRTQPGKPEMAENVPSNYSFDIAADRAERGLRAMLAQIEDARQGKPLTVSDMLSILGVVEIIQPFLCKRMNLGYQGVVLPSSNVSEWPSTDLHLVKCDDCGYHRIMRGVM